MRKVSDYRRHAEECRQLMRGARTPEHREMLHQMAETWESLAESREKQLERRANSDLLRDSGKSPRIATREPPDCEWPNKIPASCTEPREDKIAVVIYRASFVQKAIYDQLSKANFDLIGSMSSDLDALVTWHHRERALVQR
jgi:hypothetical protein